VEKKDYYITYYANNVPVIRAKYPGESENYGHKTDWDSYPDQEMLSELFPVYDSDNLNDEIDEDDTRADQQVHRKSIKMASRFGGVYADGTTLGQFILEEGPGGGFYSLPIALDKYEKLLGIKPEEAWLLKRILT